MFLLVSAGRHVPDLRHHVTEENSGGAGRPRVAFQAEQLIFLRQLGNSWTRVAHMFAVSRSTITRRVRELQLTNIDRFSSISDPDLGNLISGLISVNYTLLSSKYTDSVFFFVGD